MELLLFLAADYAAVDASGKLNILGAFNRITSSEFPAVHRSMYVVARLGAEPGEFDIERQLVLRFLDEDANELGEATVNFAIPRPKEPGRGQFNAILEIRDLELPLEGRYEFRIYVDNDHKGVLSLDVAHSETASPVE